MSKISMLIRDEDLALIDEVAKPNRTAFMIQASLDRARSVKRVLEDAEIADICAQTSVRDKALAEDFACTLSDGE